MMTDQDEYNRYLDDIEARIAMKKEQLGDLYTNSKDYDDDAAALHIGDQAYQQVYHAITSEQLPWEAALDEQINKQRKTREKVELAMSAFNLAEPYLQKKCRQYTHNAASSTTARYKQKAYNDIYR